jgi:MscS family membrane protein
MKNFIYTSLFIVCMMGAPSYQAAFGQAAPSVTNVAEQAAPQEPKDPYGRTTPRGTVQGYLDAMIAQDFDKALQYFDFSYLSKSKRALEGIETVKNFQKILNNYGRFKATSLLSEKSVGNTDDTTETRTDNVGSYSWKDETFPIVIESSLSENGIAIWLFSPQTLKNLPLIAKESQRSLVEKYTPEILSQNKIGGVSFSHWALLVGLIPLSLLITWVLGKILLRGSKIVSHKIWPEHHFEIINAFALPLFLLGASYIFVAMTRFGGIPIIARQYVSELPMIVAWLAVIIFCWKVLNAFFDVSIRRSTKNHNAGKLSVILFFKRAALFVFIAVAIITTLDMLGVDVTTGIAALGIGGIAIALGAQKTIENFVGSVTVIFDQSARIGDYCTVGAVSGTIEKIGMRSTRIRTLDRTLVTIPNGQFASDVIENYAFRDKFRYIHKFGVRYETTPDQMRYLLVEMRAILYAHPRVDNDPARVRFLSLDNYQLSIEVFAYVRATDFSEFLEIQEDLHLRMMDVVHEAGCDFAFPSQTVYMAKDSQPPPEQVKRAEDKVKAWEDTEELQLPRFDIDKIRALKGTIKYPPKGAAMSKKDD